MESVPEMSVTIYCIVAQAIERDPNSLQMIGQQYPDLPAPTFNLPGYPYKHALADISKA